MKKLFFAFGFYFILFAYANGQGILRGKVTDEKGETLIGVAIVLKSNPGIGTTTDLDGNYSLKIQSAGQQTIVLTYVGFISMEETINPVNGEVVVRNYILKTSSHEMKEVEVTAKAVKARDYYVEKLKRNSATTLDYITSETLKKTGDANVLNAVARVSGVSTNNDFITVRGIGDRYVKTSINGSVIPTLDPFTNNIKLDLFPSTLIDNIIITKTASPDLPGDWSGAYLSVETKDYPENFSVNVETSLGYNNQSTFKDVISSQHSSTDWIGYDNGLRNRSHGEFVSAIINPGQYQEFVALGLGSYYSSLGVNENNWGQGTNTGETYFKLGLIQLGLLAPGLIDDADAIATAKDAYLSGPYKAQAFSVLNSKVAEIGKSFPVNWNTIKRKAPLNFSQSFSIGNQINFLGKPLGYLVGFKYGSSIQYDPNAKENRERFDGGLSSAVTQELSKETNGWNGLVNLSFKPSPNNSFSLVFMPNLVGTNKVKNPLDKRDVSTYVWTNSMYYEQRRQLVYQVKSENYFPASKIKMELNASYTDGKSSAPDFKNLQYYEDPISKTFQIGGTIGDGIHRYYRYLNDDLFDSRVSIQIPLSSKPGMDKKIKFGGGYQFNNKKSDQYDYALNFGPNSTLVLTNRDIDNFLLLSNFDIHNYTDIYGHSYNTIDTYYVLNTSPANNTFGKSKLVSFFAMTDLNLSSRIRFSGGVRLEKADVLTDVTEFDSLGHAKNDLRRFYNNGYPAANPGKLNEVSVLPSVNFVYKIGVDEEAPINLRLNYYNTVARPSIRELSDVATFDYDLRKFVFGNSDLKMVQINNYDARLEYYFNTNDNVSLSTFYKHFKNHIELVESGGFTWQNVDKSNVLGIELEAKKKLNSHFDLLVNLTVVDSRTKYVRTRLEFDGGVKTYIPLDTVSRSMFGQAPYVINSIFTYRSDSLGLTLGLSYNVQGPRLIIASSVKEIPNVYERPRHLIDFKTTKSLGKHFNVSFTIKDILNSPVIKSYKHSDGWRTDYERYSYGTNYLVSVSYKL